MRANSDNSRRPSDRQTPINRMLDAPKSSAKQWVLSLTLVSLSGLYGLLLAARWRPLTHAKPTTNRLRPKCRIAS